MYGLNDAHNERERQRILARAEKKHGGQTTTWRLTQDVKGVAQKYNVADILKIEALSRDGLKVVLSDKLHSRLFAQRNDSAFWEEFTNAINDCGYNLAVGDNFIEIHKV